MQEQHLIATILLVATVAAIRSQDAEWLMESSVRSAHIQTQIEAREHRWARKAALRVLPALLLPALGSDTDSLNFSSSTPDPPGCDLTESSMPSRGSDLAELSSGSQKMVSLNCMTVAVVRLAVLERMNAIAGPRAAFNLLRQLGVACDRACEQFHGWRLRTLEDGMVLGFGVNSNGKNPNSAKPTLNAVRACAFILREMSRI